MAEHNVTTITHNFIKLNKTLELTAGGKLADDAEVLAFAQKTVPAGKKVSVRIMIRGLVTDA